MELLLRIFTRRNVALAAALACLVVAADRYQEHPRRWYRQWRYPPQRSAQPADAEISRLNDVRQSRQLRRRYARVVSLLDEAESQGFDVSALRRKAAVALRFDAPDQRRHAATILSETELLVPRRKTQYIPVYSDEEDDIPPDVPGRRVGRRR